MANSRRLPEELTDNTPFHIKLASTLLQQPLYSFGHLSDFHRLSTFSEKKNFRGKGNFFSAENQKNRKKIGKFMISWAKELIELLLLLIAEFSLVEKISDLKPPKLFHTMQN